MGILDTIVKKGKEITKRSNGKAKAFEQQTKVLRKLLEKAADTEFGRKYGFNSILQADDMHAAYAARVPAGPYGNMMPWWDRARQGEKDVAWPGKVQYFALS
ncbi:MAG TPA: GH3 auxin-responsive promoter family protein, partial [Bacteroidia bacterium]|nr:GH3 auxin-responsive promoter family protein [Bacteroidia bacterium]